MCESNVTISLTYYVKIISWVFSQIRCAKYKSYSLLLEYVNDLRIVVDFESRVKTFDRLLCVHCHRLFVIVSVVLVERHGLLYFVPFDILYWMWIKVDKWRCFFCIKRDYQTINEHEDRTHRPTQLNYVAICDFFHCKFRTGWKISW